MGLRRRLRCKTPSASRWCSSNTISTSTSSKTSTGPMVHSKKSNPESARPTQPTRPVSIMGTGSYLPEKVMTNADLEKLVETSDEWIVTRTGIRERRIAPPGVCTSDMAARAAMRALEEAHIKPEEVDLIIVG